MTRLRAEEISTIFEREGMATGCVLPPRSGDASVRIKILEMANLFLRPMAVLLLVKNTRISSSSRLALEPKSCVIPSQSF